MGSGPDRGASGAEDFPRVAFVGSGGGGGIAAGMYLAKAGIHSFTIFEKSAAPGGTRWENTYPDASGDGPAR